MTIKAELDLLGLKTRRYLTEVWQLAKIAGVKNTAQDWPGADVLTVLLRMEEQIEGWQEAIAEVFEAGLDGFDPLCMHTPAPQLTHQQPLS